MDNNNPESGISGECVRRNYVQGVLMGPTEKLAESIMDLIFAGQFDDLSLPEVLGSLDLVHARILTLATEKDS